MKLEFGDDQTVFRPNKPLQNLQQEALGISTMHIPHGCEEMSEKQLEAENTEATNLLNNLSGGDGHWKGIAKMRGEYLFDLSCIFKTEMAKAKESVESQQKMTASVQISTIKLIMSNQIGLWQTFRVDTWGLVIEKCQLEMKIVLPAVIDSKIRLVNEDHIKRARELVKSMYDWLKQFAACEAARNYTRTFKDKTAQDFLARGVNIVREIDAFKLEYKRKCGYVFFERSAYSKTRILVLGMYWILCTGLPLDMPQVRNLTDDTWVVGQLEIQIQQFEREKLPGSTNYTLCEQLAGVCSTVTNQLVEVDMTAARVDRQCRIYVGTLPDSPAQVWQV